jgi:hypothetical protein
MKIASIGTALMLTLLLTSREAASADEPEALARAGQALIGGRASAPGEDLAVVAVVAGSRPICTGVLVSSDVVLTAAHCLKGARQLAVVFGARVHSEAVRRRVVRVRPHPEYEVRDSSHDLAALLLDKPAPAAVEPVRIARSLPAGFDGVMVRIVGFGIADAAAGMVGTKREMAVPVLRIEDDSLRLANGGQQACRGDSGGPAFLRVGETEQVVAVVSGGESECKEGARLARVDGARSDFIGAFMELTARRAQSYGSVCSTDASCESGVCARAVDAEEHATCSRACTRDADCGSNHNCDRRAAVCRLLGPSPGARGTPCMHDGDCESLLCARNEEGQRVCSTPCAPQDGGCRVSEICTRAYDSSEAFACFPAAPPPAAAGCGVAVGGGASLLPLLMVVLAGTLLAGHRTRAWVASWMAALLASVALPSRADAYVRATGPDGTPVAWRSAEIRLRLHEETAPAGLPPGLFRRALEAAAATWSFPNVPCTALQITVESTSGTGATAEANPDGHVFFQTERWCPSGTISGEDCYPPQTLAVTRTRVFGGEILDAQIDINAVGFTWADLVQGPPAAGMIRTRDLQNVLTHELGHLVGLEHNCRRGSRPHVDNAGQELPGCATAPPRVREATMYPSPGEGEIERRTLASDDAAGVCDIYPRTAPGAPPAAGCMIAAGDRAAGPGVASASVWIALFVAACRRLRRLRPRGRLTSGGVDGRLEPRTCSRGASASGSPRSHLRAS